MSAVYVTADELRKWRHITPAQFNVGTDEELDQLLTAWSEHVKEIIDNSYRPPRDFLDEAGGDLMKVPKSVRSVALRALSNYVTMAQNARESGYVRMDEFRVTVDMADAILTRAMRRELPRRYPGGLPFRGSVAHGETVSYG